MAFRAGEAARLGYESAERYLISREIRANPQEAERSRARLLEIVEDLGPVISEYPAWHPIVSNHDVEDRVWGMCPSTRCGYAGLDHNVYFANGFITCPYDNPEVVIQAVEKLPLQRGSLITAELLDVQFYQPNAKPVLVKCHWGTELENGTIPLSVAMPLFLRKELERWTPGNDQAETWDLVVPYVLGQPYGRRSSLFVSQETGQAMKKMWDALVASGMFGPVCE